MPDMDATAQIPSAAACDAAPLLALGDASYAVRDYRSFEFVSFEVKAGQVAVAAAHEHAPVRDLLLCAAGLVRPSLGTVCVEGRALKYGPFGRHAAAGLGVFSGVADADMHLTVEEALRRELGPAASEDAVLAHLADWRIATHADRRLERLEPLARAYFSVCLAAAVPASVAVADLADPFCRGLTVEEAREVATRARELACRDASCFVFGVSDPATFDAADVAIPLDTAAEDACRALASQEVC